MSGKVGRGSGGVVVSQAIPGISRKVVQSIKEICGNSDDEIYAMLKECNMDPNQAVQHLLNQDPFLEVKRKRDKKKEKLSSKEQTDNRSRAVAVGIPKRGERNGAVSERSDRRSSVSSYNSNDFGSVRSALPVTMENGAHSVIKNPTSGMSYGQALQKVNSSTAGLPHVATASGSADMTNGSPFYSRSVSSSSGVWAAGSNHATMADIVKSSVVPVSVPPALATQVSGSLESNSSSYIQDFPYPSAQTSLGMYESVNDPILNPLHSSTMGTGSNKRDVGTVGNQRLIGSKSSSVLPLDGAVFLPSESQPLSASPNTVSSPALPAKLEEEVHGSQSNDSSTTSIQHEISERQTTSLGDTGKTLGIQTNRPEIISSVQASVTSTSQTTVTSGQTSGKHLYQQQPFGSQKVMGFNLEWKPKSTSSSVHSMSEVVESSQKNTISEPVSVSLSEQSGAVSGITSKLNLLSTKDEPSVIMPGHLQVAETDYAHLSFGSFGETFLSSHLTSYGANEADMDPASVASVPIVSDIEVPSLSTASSTASVSQSNVSHEETSAAVEHSSSAAEGLPESVPETIASQPEVLKSTPVVEQSTQFSYLQAVPNYSGLGLVTQVPSGMYSYEVSESQPQDASRPPNLVQSYTDPTTSYYSPAFRPSSDADGRYTQFLPSNSASKYSGNLTLLAAQSLPSLQEAGNSVLLSSTSPLPQISSAPTIPSVPQQHVPIHAYPAQPAGLPLGHFGSVFGYQYVPPSYTYMHSPYQPTYAGNNGYPQAPIGSSFSPGQNSYQPSAAAALKYPFPQYKPLTATGSTQTAGVAGYGGYNAASSVYAANPTVTAAPASNYEDVGVPPYKESSVFMSNQQAEGSTMWIQAQLSRDMVAAGMQPNSYYNISGQGQHSAYTHTQSLGHAHTHPAAGYASLFHPGQSGTAPSVHQLLQPQTLVGGTGAGTQAGPYQQPQRAQQSWPNTY